MLKIIDATVGYLLCFMGGRILYWRHRERAAGALPQTFKKILVIRPGGMGDMILLMPMLKALRQHYPEAQIDLVCEKRNQEIPGLTGQSVRLLLYDAHPGKTLSALMRQGYDLVIDTEQFHNFSAVMVWLSGAPIRIGFKINPIRNPIYTHLVNYNLEGYEAGEFMRLLEPVGRGRGQCSVSSVQRSGEEKRVQGSGQILIHISASNRYKRWAPEKFAQLAVALVREADAESGTTACQVVLVGGKHDRGLAEDVARRAGLGDRLVVMAGNQSLAETASLIERASLFIGGDSGLMHLAVSLGIPTVALFGPSDPLKWAAPGDRTAVVCKGLACSPCFIFGYHKLCHSIACMAEITVEDVLAAVAEVKKSKDFTANLH